MNNGMLFDLRNGVPELRPKEDSHCFFLVEHSGDKSFMSAVAQRLLNRKCKDFHFYGRYGGEWENASSFCQGGGFCPLCPFCPGGTMSLHGMRKAPTVSDRRFV